MAARGDVLRRPFHSGDRREGSGLKRRASFAILWFRGAVPKW